MPLGLKRYQNSKQSHFVTFTCYRRLRHLNDAAARDIVVAALEQARVRYRFRVYGFRLVILGHQLGRAILQSDSSGTATEASTKTLADHLARAELLTIILKSTMAFHER